MTRHAPSLCFGIAFTDAGTCRVVPFFGESEATVRDRLANGHHNGTRWVDLPDVRVVARTTSSWVDVDAGRDRHAGSAADRFPALVALAERYGVTSWTEDVWQVLAELDQAQAELDVLRHGARRDRADHST